MRLAASRQARTGYSEESRMVGTQESRPTAQRAAWVGSGRHVTAAGAAVLVTLLLTAVTATPALASSQYRLYDHFKGPAATFRPTSVAVDNAVTPAKVYVGDYDNKAIDRFSAAGAYECQITGKGENSTSASECDSTKGSSAEVPGALGTAVLGGLAVDGEGHLFYANLIGGTVDEFNEAGAWVSPGIAPGGKDLLGVASDGAGNLYVAAEGSAAVYKCAGASCAVFAKVTAPTGVAVDTDPASASNGDVYVASSVTKTVDVYNATGELQGQLKPPSGAFGGPAQVAVGPSTGRVFVVDTLGKAVDVFSSRGAFVYQIPIPGASPSPAAASIDATNGFLYVADQVDGVVDVYEPVFEPSATTGAATEVGERAAILRGTVDPEVKEGGSYISSCGFQYISEASYDHLQTVVIPEKAGVSLEVDGEALNLSSEPAQQTAAIVQEGLEQLAAVGAGNVRVTGPAGGPWKIEFTGALTSATPPRITFGERAAEVEAKGGRIEGDWAAASAVECVQTTPYSATTVVSAQTSGLSPSTTYDYRLVVENEEGHQGHTAPAMLTTSGPPGITSQTAEAIVSNGTATGEIDPYGERTACKLEFVTGAQYAASGYAGAHTVPCSPEVLQAGFESDRVTARITGLAPATDYHYRFAASDSGGATKGADEQFATFGVKSFAFEARNESGTQFAQAGGHPYGLMDSFALNTATTVAGTPLASDANLKNVNVELPPGLVGNPEATPKCAPYNVAKADCSGATQVGTMHICTTKGHGGRHLYCGNGTVPIYNVEPPQGMAAQFGARFNGLTTLYIDARVRAGGDYGVTADVVNSSAAEAVVSAEVSLWGVPAAASHDAERYCPESGQINEEPHAPGQPGIACSERGPLIPFLSNPTSCSGEREARMSVEPWQEDEPPVLVGASAKMPAITGCGHVHFTPSMSIAPTTTASSSPTGLNVELKVPQNEDPNGLATADLKDAKVVLPAGVTVNPSSANGLAACPLLTGNAPHPGAVGIDLENGEPANCPNASKVGTVKIKTPLLEEELEGGVYVAQQDANPFKSLLALYITAEDPERGVVVKLGGHVELNPLTGQVTTTFDENPQLPFNTLKLDFFGGERAALATPRTCGTYTPSSVLEPWSHQGAPGETGTPDAEPFIHSFDITSAPNGIACGSSPFAPAFAAGTSDNPAGAYSPFTMNLTRKDGEQRLSTVSLTMPPGLAGMISHVTPCDEAEANAGSCPAASKIGHVVSEAGVGNQPVTLPEAGKPEDPVFLTEKYGGAPFGLSIVVPAEAGPFNLGTVIVRARIEVNPTTAQVTVISNPMPSILQGIPLDVKAIHVSIDRPEFMFNATSCEPMSVAGAIGSQEGASADVASRYQAAGCAGLKFEPKFSALIHAHHSRKDGEYLHVAIASAFGQANIHQVHVTLPGKLPSRLDTLKHACTEQQFAANPAGCPAESIVGTAIAHTPILPVPMEGPAIFVSHAGKGFPNLDLLLQGDGINITLVGDTFINKKQVTTSTFKTVPDVPVSRFDLVLPAGPHSALAGVGNMCVKPLYMPVSITGQNGALTKQRTRIKVTGCKPELRLLGHKLKGRRAIIHVSVPSAGRLFASGRGLMRSAKRARKAGSVTIAVSLGRHDRRVLAKHPHQRINAKIRLRFQRGHGRPLHAAVKVLIG